MRINTADIIEGLEEAKELIVEFLKKRLSSSESKGYIELTLFQQAKEGELEITGFGMSLDDEPENIADEILEAAEEHCRGPGFRGKVRYLLRVKAQSKKCLFTLFHPHVDMEDYEGDPTDIDADELPSARGIAGQAMRHAEVYMRENVRLTRSVTESMQTTIREQRAEISEMKRSHVQLRRDIEDIQDMKFRRDIQINEIEDSRQMKQQFTQIALGVGLPILMAKATGQSLDQQTMMNLLMQVLSASQQPQGGQPAQVPPPPQLSTDNVAPLPSQAAASQGTPPQPPSPLSSATFVMTPAEEGMASFLSTITKEQMEVFMKTLDGNQQARLLQVWQALQEKNQQVANVQQQTQNGQAHVPPQGPVVEGSFEPG